MMAELFVWKEEETVIREVKTRLCKASNTLTFSRANAEDCGSLGLWGDPQCPKPHMLN